MGLTRPKSSQINTTSTKFEDTVLVVNSLDIRKNPGNERPDQGIIFTRANNPVTQNIGLIWDEPTGKFTFITTTDTDSFNGQVTATGYVPVATGDLSVTGQATVTGDFTANGNITMPNAPVLKIYTGTIGYATGTTTIPADNTVPLKTEGTEIISLTVTPSSNTSKFTLAFNIMVDCGSSNRNLSATVWRNTTCVHATSVNLASAGRPNSLAVHFTDSPNTTNDITYSVRFGTSSPSTWYINTTTGSIRFKGLTPTSYSIIEHN